MNKFKLYMEALWEIGWDILKPVLKLTSVILVGALLIFFASLSIKMFTITLVALLGTIFLCLFILNVNELYKEKLGKQENGEREKFVAIAIGKDGEEVRITREHIGERKRL